MELKRNREGAEEKNKPLSSKVAIKIYENGRASKTQETASTIQTEVPNIRLSPEQIEEIHADEYSLTLFYAVRMEPLSLLEIKRQFAEPESKKAQSVMDRFVKAGLVHITPEGKYYSNFPENYINYSHYRYDSDLEARKDAKVFQIMKEQTGKSEFWKDKTYFSMDAFYSEEQTREMIEMFKAIKRKAKEYANENSRKKSIKGLRFRRMKFFDITFGFLFAFVIMIAVGTNAFAGGNDPTVSVAMFDDAVAAIEKAGGGGGNDPTAPMAAIRNVQLVALAQQPTGTGGGGHDPDGPSEPTPPPGGGGHDPGGGGGHDPDQPNTRSSINSSACVVRIESQLLTVSNPRLCKLQFLIEFLDNCEQYGEASCNAALAQLEGMTIHLMNQSFE
jgi:hypothetical protein